MIESESASSNNEPNRKHPKNESQVEESEDLEMPAKVQQPSSSNRLPVAPPPRTSSQQNVGSVAQQSRILKFFILSIFTFFRHSTKTS